MADSEAPLPLERVASSSTKSSVTCSDVDSITSPFGARRMRLGGLASPGSAQRRNSDGWRESTSRLPVCYSNDSWASNSASELRASTLTMMASEPSQPAPRERTPMRRRRSPDSARPSPPSDGEGSGSSRAIPVLMRVTGQERKDGATPLAAAEPEPKHKCLTVLDLAERRRAAAEAAARVAAEELRVQEELRAERERQAEEAAAAVARVEAQEAQEAAVAAAAAQQAEEAAAAATEAAAAERQDADTPSAPEEPAVVAPPLLGRRSNPVLRTIIPAAPCSAARERPNAALRPEAGSSVRSSSASKKAAPHVSGRLTSPSSRASRYTFSPPSSDRQASNGTARRTASPQGLERQASSRSNRSAKRTHSLQAYERQASSRSTKRSFTPPQAKLSKRTTSPPLQNLRALPSPPGSARSPQASARRTASFTRSASYNFSNSPPRPVSPERQSAVEEPMSPPGLDAFPPSAQAELMVVFKHMKRASIASQGRHSVPQVRTRPSTGSMTVVPHASPRVESAQKAPEPAEGPCEPVAQPRPRTAQAVLSQHKRALAPPTAPAHMLSTQASSMKMRDKSFKAPSFAAAPRGAARGRSSVTSQWAKSPSRTPHLWGAAAP
eukprot:TRINITY_DN3163_c0_g2_i1.p1 TRINITY_DN3163_c0_g2~~TRINITY_DN3163_c0_g2_i1.p1  ORF type:complete len:612 (+),score=99.18 TRINITY_DN3163_c0_g2_i1:58-1893(+)